MRNFFAFVFLLSITAGGGACAGTTGAMRAARYTVLIGTLAIGHEASTYNGREAVFAYQYDDGGRGPQLTSRLTLDAQGLPASVRTTGHDTLKNRVHETYRYDDGLARWDNAEESSEHAMAKNAFYVSVNGVPEETAVLARALLAAPAGKLPLLPDGEARIERLGDREVRCGHRAERVTQYAISGLDFSATPVWLDASGNFFALSKDDLTVVREGWEAAVPALEQAQEQAAVAHATAIAHTLAHRAAAIVFQHASVFDAESATVRPNMTVVVAGDRITAVGPDGAVALPARAEFINATGKTLIPGLWDMHAHLNEMDGPLNLAAGVTTVRDLGNEVDKLQDLRRRFDSGEAVGPRVIMGGLMDAPGPNHGPTDVFVTNEREARAAVDRFAELGYEQIKVYSSISPALMPAIIDEAHRWALPVNGHVPAFMTAEQVVREGVNELTHIDYLFLNFLRDEVRNTARPARFTTVARDAGTVDLHSARVRNFVSLLVRRHIVVDPTLSVFEALLTDRRGTVSRGFSPVADRLPPHVRRGVEYSGLPVPPGLDQRYRDSFRAMLHMIYTLWRAGVPIVAGTDSMGGFPLQRELELYVQAGIPANEVLKLATLGAARVMHHDRERGSIQPGKFADLALVDGNPAQNISDIRRVVTTVKGGVIYQAAELYQAIGVTVP